MEVVQGSQQIILKGTTPQEVVPKDHISHKGEVVLNPFMIFYGSPYIVYNSINMHRAYSRVGFLHFCIAKIM